MQNQVKSRDSNIELLRIVLMAMIVLSHLIIHGCGLSRLSTNEYVSTHKDVMLFVVGAFTLAAVNCFIFITGYYGIRFKLKSLVSFIIQAIFYSVGFYLLFCAIAIFRHESLWNTVDLLKSFLPLTSGKWWFLTVYIGLYISSPLLNKGLEAITKTQLIVFLLVSFYFESIFIITGSDLFAGNGHTLFHFVLMYCTGYFMHRYVRKINYAFVLYVVASLLLFCGAYLAFIYYKQSFTWNFFSFVNPLSVLAAIFIFYTFKNIKLENNKLINSSSMLVFGIYLIHDQPDVRMWLADLTAQVNEKSQNWAINFLYLLGFTFIILGCCMLIEKIRQLIFKPLNNKLFETKRFKQVANKLDVI